MNRKILLDCDPGHDDAIAILLAGQKKYFNLLGITTVSGNQTIEKTTQNAINLTEFLKIDVPIAMGASDPICRKRMNCPEIHGESGLDGFEFPKYSKKCDSRNAIKLMEDILLSNDKVTVITTGPMTNLGMAIKHNKEILKHIDEIIFMGGSTTDGNVTPAAEFNILVDPEAADIVLTSGVPIRMIGLNITRTVLVRKSAVERMRKINNQTSKLFVALMEVFNRNQASFFGLTEGGPLHDPITIASMIDDNLITWKNMNVKVDTSHSPLEGKTYCEEKEPHNCKVAMAIDINRFWDIIEEGIRNYN